MFDATATIGLTFPADNGSAKKLIVRWPNDEEWTAWRKRRKVISQRGSPNLEHSQLNPDAADLRLLRAIALADATDVTVREASCIIGRLSHCEVVNNPERIGSAYTIGVKIMRSLITSHIVRMPNAAELVEYKRHMLDSVVIGPHGRKTITTINLEALAALYDRCIQRVEGYAANVPIVHKAEVANVLKQLAEREAEACV